MALPYWRQWLARDSVTLEDAVALSLGRAPTWRRTITSGVREFDPRSVLSREEYAVAIARFDELARQRAAPGGAPAAFLPPALAGDAKPPAPAVGPVLVQFERVQWEHPALVDPDGRDRLEVLREAFAAVDELLPPVPGAGRRVHLVDFARFAVAHGWAIPAPLQALAGGAVAMVARMEPAAPPRTMKRDAMVRELERQWPTIDKDLREAQRKRPSALRELARAKCNQHGYWMPHVAVDIARKLGRIPPSSVPAPVFPPRR